MIAVIDEVIKRAETEIEHRLNLIEQLKTGQRDLEETLETCRLELQGWEAYLQVLREQAGK